MRKTVARLRFVKMHGLGNDYVYVDCFSQPKPDGSALARAVSPRRTSVGSDGVILILPSFTADCRMEMYNADGSRGEMCGNGIRCLGKYVFERGIARKNPLRVETDAGVKSLYFALNKNGAVEAVTVDMGEPVLDSRAIPVATDHWPVVQYPLQIGNHRYEITAVSMGNPHCVLFVEDVATSPVTELGPILERHPFFPNRVNVEFAQVLNRNSLRMRVWERGSGETHACGTGACASVVAAVLQGLGDRQMQVHLKGGVLDVEWREKDNRVYMTGPAEEVFEGELVWPPLE
ncbi:MAG: diaminopimelate epimerase [Candidatus Binatia bacterium]|nr:MAG: diaminopimelate epimerase [Candidatus Binatia bacterium]